MIGHNQDLHWWKVKIYDFRNSDVAGESRKGSINSGKHQNAVQMVLAYRRRRNH